MEQERTTFQLLTALVERDVVQKGVGPLAAGAVLAITVREVATYSLQKGASTMKAVETVAPNPDMTFTLSEKGLRHLIEVDSQDVGDIGLELLKMVTHSDPEMKLDMKVAVGPWEMLRKGYFSVLPQGGLKVTQHLASHGFSSLGKIREGISKLRQK